MFSWWRVVGVLAFSYYLLCLFAFLYLPYLYRSLPSSVSTPTGVFEMFRSVVARIIRCWRDTPSWVPSVCTQGYKSGVRGGAAAYRTYNGLRGGGSEPPLDGISRHCERAG